MPQRIGIVGGSGYVGFSLARYLSQEFEVTILDVRSLEDPNFDLAFRQCDVRSYENLCKALQGIDLVIHTAIIQIPLINEQKKLGYEVNVIGTQNVCRAVEENANIKGMILAGSWHTIGERSIVGVVDEEFGLRPDKVEERAGKYALSKMAQESIVRLYDEMSKKIYGILRMGTVLGEQMPKGTAANIFIEKGMKGEPITPFRHSMYRPMLYVDINDICGAYSAYAMKILSGECGKKGNSLAHIFNVYYPRPITILRLAEIVKSAIVRYSHGVIKPRIEIVDSGLPALFTEDDVDKMRIDISKAKSFLGLGKLKGPQEALNRIVKARFEHVQKV
jgi:nucleoside-diphosphate-sugar epimerase